MKEDIPTSRVGVGGGLPRMWVLQGTEVSSNLGALHSTHNISSECVQFLTTHPTQGGNRGFQDPGFYYCNKAAKPRVSGGGLTHNFVKAGSNNWVGAVPRI